MYGGEKSENFQNFFMFGNDPKRLPASSMPLFSPKFDRFHPFLDPILRHAVGNLAVFWPHHAQKTAIFSKIHFNVRCDVNLEFSHGVSNIFWNKSLCNKCFWKQSEPLRCRLARDAAQFPTPKLPHKKGRGEGVCMGVKKVKFFRNVYS